jgi:lipopolysaccharide/colanic/teichoic acid biosynthesis glycosyltransferase
MNVTTTGTTITVPPTLGRVPRYKRSFDLVGSVLLLLLLGPLGAVVAIVVKLSSRGPILFRQERVGLNGRHFVMYKFRTMYHGADQTVHRTYFQQYRQGLEAPDQEGQIFKLRRDPRITRPGRIMRLLALDEIPQILNVIKGDMSLVGPRPPIPYEVDLYSQHDRARLSAKPGLTGLWQIKGRDTVDFDTMIALDLDYIKRQSLRMDLGIVLATVPTLIRSCVKH